MNTPRLAAGLVVVIALSGCAGRDPADLASRPAVPQSPLPENRSTMHPSHFAWELFIELNRPLDVAGRFVVWEGWPSAESVFGDPDAAAKELRWPTVPSHLGRWEGPPRQHVLFDEANRGKPAPPFEEHAAAALESEVRINRTAFLWIKTQTLWFLSDPSNPGVGVKAFLLVDSPVEFPPGSILVKAGWKIIDQDEKTSYYWQEVDGQIYGLVAFHVMAKVLPEWFWATWEHESNPGRRELVTPSDEFGLDGGGVSERLRGLLAGAGMDPDLWSHYRLNGAQTAFTDRQGRPVILGNTVLEHGFTDRSSCMTCHARASIGGDALDPFRDPRVGVPDPAWYAGDTNRPIRQLDFSWVLTRARPRTKPLGAATARHP